MGIGKLLLQAVQRCLLRTRVCQLIFFILSVKMSTSYAAHSEPASQHTDSVVQAYGDQGEDVHSRSDLTSKHWAISTDTTNDRWMISTDMTESKQNVDTSTANDWITSNEALFFSLSENDKTRHHRLSTGHRQGITEDATRAEHRGHSNKANTLSHARRLGSAVSQVTSADSSYAQWLREQHGPVTKTRDVTSRTSDNRPENDKASVTTSRENKTPASLITSGNNTQGSARHGGNTSDGYTSDISIAMGHRDYTSVDDRSGNELPVTTADAASERSLGRNGRRHERHTNSDAGGHVDPMTSAYTMRDEAIAISVQPLSMQQVLEDSYKAVTINCSLPNRRDASMTALDHLRISVTVRSQQTRVLVPYPMSVQNSSIIPLQLDNTGVLIFPLDCSKNPNVFGVHTNTVGRSRLTVRVTLSTSYTDKVRTLYEQDIHISVVRKVRRPDIVFDCVMPVIMLIVSFSTGCLSDIIDLREHVRKPMPVLIGLSCQFILLPLITLAVAKLALSEPGMGLGLLFLSTAPGGGGGHLMVAIAGGDIPLSVLLNFTAITCTLVFAPIWLLTTSSILKSDFTSITYGNIILWISLAIAVYFLGISLRKRSETIAEAFLNWLTKPLLLLSGILYITLGLYTNTYLFLVFDSISLFVMLFYSSIAYCLAFFLPFILRQPFEYSKTIASHTAVPHCLLSLVLVRYSLNQPASDIASIAPIIMLIFSYVPFLAEFLFKVARAFIRKRLEKLEEEKERLSSAGTQGSLVNMTNHAAVESSTRTSVISQTAHVDSYKSITVQEQVTVL